MTTTPGSRPAAAPGPAPSATPAATPAGPPGAGAPEGKIVLITGANKGIGLATARELGRAGLTVLVGARDQGRGTACSATTRPRPR
jgi:hypothetical protein